MNKFSFSLIFVTCLWLLYNSGYITISKFYINQFHIEQEGTLIVKNNDVLLKTSNNDLILYCSPVLRMRGCFSGLYEQINNKKAFVDLIVVNKIFAGDVYIVKSIDIDGVNLINEIDVNERLKKMKLIFNSISLFLIFLSVVVFLFGWVTMKKNGRNANGQTDPATDTGDRLKREREITPVTSGDLSSRLFQRNQSKAEVICRRY